MPSGTTRRDDARSGELETPVAGYTQRALTALDPFVSHAVPELTVDSDMWLPAQRHAGENIGQSETHTIFVELKGDAAGVADDRALGPST